MSASCGGFFDVEKLQKDLAAIEGRMAAPDFWSNRERAQADVEEVSRLRSLINPFHELERGIEDFSALQELAAEESDALIDELTAYMIQPGAEYHHQWQKGNIVIWDNRCSYHKAAGDYPPEEDRIHWRVSIKEHAAVH